jgi:putative membrane protein
MHWFCATMCATLAILSSSGASWAQERPYEWGWGMHPMMWGAWGFGMMLMMVLFWALVIVGLVVLVRWLVGQGRDSRGDAALEILRQRYARGEINQEEFETKKRDLS